MLNSNYRAVTSNDVNLFKEKQKFMCAVFDKTLQIDRGKKHARDHESDYNAQSAHQKLIAFYTKSTNVRVRAFTALIYITSDKIE